MPDPKRPVTIEDLIRLKRAERPPAEFWAEFDRELRAKQLAALVEKKPWWQSLPAVFGGWRRYHLPLGATAILAVTFLSLREAGEQSALPQPVSAPAAAGKAVAETGTRETAVRGSPDALAEKRSMAPAAETAAPVVPVAASTSEAVSPGELSRIVALVSDTSGEASADLTPPSARYIAANLAAAAAPVDSSLRRSLLVAPAVAENRSVRGAVVEPLSQITPPAEARRARFISAMAVAGINDLGGRSAEREARKLSDDRLNDHVRRFNLKANSLSMKL